MSPVSKIAMKTKTKKQSKPLRPKKTTRQEIDEAAVDIGGPDGAGNLAARVVLAAFHVGPNAARISKFLGVPAKDFKTMADNLRRNGCWKGGKVAVTDVDDGQALYLDAPLMSAVAMGWVERADG
jgi:hypothetical protein